MFLKMSRILLKLALLNFGPPLPIPNFPPPPNTDICVKPFQVLSVSAASKFQGKF